MLSLGLARLLGKWKKMSEIVKNWDGFWGYLISRDNITMSKNKILSCFQHLIDVKMLLVSEYQIKFSTLSHKICKKTHIWTRTLLVYMCRQGVLDKIRGVDTDFQPWILQ